MDAAFVDVAASVDQVARAHAVPGVAVAAVVDGELAHVATHGMRDLEAGLPVTPDSPSRWYSISKPVTVLALARLVEAGKLQWDQPVATLVPGLRFADAMATERATVRDCILHQTGLPSGNWTWWGAPSDPAELLRRLPHVPCSAGFRTGHCYQNLNFTILGEIFRTLGTDWHRAVRDVLTPLGIHPLTRLTDFVATDRVIGYGPNGFAPAVRAADADFEGVAPASALCGSVIELAHLGRALALGGRELVAPHMWEELIAPRHTLRSSDWPELDESAICMAGRCFRYRGELVLHWAGGWVGYGAQILAVPSRRVAACTLGNRTSNNAVDLLAFALLDRAAGWERLPWDLRYLKRKQALRRKAEERLEARLARPCAAWPVAEVAGRFAHPGYGDLSVTDQCHLRFRDVDLPLIPRSNGSFSCDGLGGDSSEISWDLRAETDDGKVTAWLFNPDAPKAPCRFTRVG